MVLSSSTSISRREDDDYAAGFDTDVEHARPFDAYPSLAALNPALRHLCRIFAVERAPTVIGVG
jgi:hypothetical protein